MDSFWTKSLYREGIPKGIIHRKQTQSQHSGEMGKVICQPSREQNVFKAPDREKNKVSFVSGILPVIICKYS